MAITKMMCQQCNAPIESATTTYCERDGINTRYDVLKRHYGLYDMR